MSKSLWFDNIRIYHLLIDRFNGGWQTPPASKNLFCGGNLQGVIDKLDYIKDLGFTAIMLSPIVNALMSLLQSPVRQEKRNAFFNTGYLQSVLASFTSSGCERCSFSVGMVSILSRKPLGFSLILWSR